MYLFIFKFLFIWPGCILFAACGSWIFVVACWIFGCGLGTLPCGVWDLVPWSGIQPRPPASGEQRLSHWTSREVPRLSFQSTPDTPITSPVSTHLPIGWSQADLCFLTKPRPLSERPPPPQDQGSHPNSPSFSSQREPSVRREETGLPPSSPLLTHQETQPQQGPQFSGSTSQQ